MSRERELLKQAVSILHDSFDGVNWTEDLINEIDAYLSKPVVEPEPMAWIDRSTLDTLQNDPCEVRVYCCNRKNNRDVPLYTTPPAQSRRPLSVEEIESGFDEDCDESWFSFFNGVRFAERAHGITEE